MVSVEDMHLATKDFLVYLKKIGVEITIHLSYQRETRSNKMPDVWGFVSGAISPITDLIDKLHTSDDERLEAKAVLLAMQTEIANRVLDYESQLVTAQSSVIVAEAQSDSWLTRSWRPITMLTLLALVVYGFVTGTVIPPDMWTVIKLGLGGYVIGRSGEKIVGGAMNAMKAREET